MVDFTDKNWQLMADAERVALLRKVQSVYPSGHNQIPKIEQQIRELEAKK